MSVHSFLELVKKEETNGKKEVKEEEKYAKKEVGKGRGRHGANFLYHIKCKREKKVLNKTSNTIVTRGKVNKVGVFGW